MMNMYQDERRSLKWWRKVFISMIHRTLLNAYIIYRQNTDKPLDRYDFQKVLITELTKDYAKRKEIKYIKRPMSSTHSLERLPEKKERQCVVCTPKLGRKKRTRYQCISCDKGLDDLKIELENVETQSKGYLKVQLDKINKIKENIENYMIELVDSDEHESHMPIYKEANKDITEIQSTLLKYLELKENINTKREKTKINLPKFSLPSFKGDLDQWLDFKTTFEDTIINNSSLNNIQKFKYIQSSLSGDAASIIKGFSLTPDTFDKAWLALNERYHCTRDLAFKYCNNILNIKYIKVTNSRNIIELIDTVKLNLRNLELLGINEEQLGNMLLITFILKKIDSNMNKDFELSLKENTFPTLQDLLTFLEKHRKGLDHINGKMYQKEDNVRKTFKTYQVNTNIIKCTYCNSSHKLGTCQEFAKLSLDDTIKFVRSKNLCINCLGVIHYAKHCPISTTEHQANTSEEQNHAQSVVAVNFLEHSVGFSGTFLPVEGEQQSFSQMGTFWLGNHHFPRAPEIFHDLNFSKTPRMLIPGKSKNKMPSTAPPSAQIKLHSALWQPFSRFILIDLVIIGADLYLDLIEPGLIKGPRDAPSAMNSKLGWIISGKSNMPNNTTSTSIQQIHVNHSTAELDDIVKKNWDAESIPTRTRKS
ncbi:hypothetical protein LAZ67_22000852 [Cordylochernes scorpioides]|uniref:Peptidase aspartic putative domain-containing protein n=1 Tax=Cordylochernes scorpioides TaxID=51811 RepID=A0ABY6LRK5_9ARAC|nr:hypothetical protein LAZ67_22000852 [Cordylochernes scorpioides]